MRTIQVIAHRGGGQEAPENTWAALQHTADLGLDWLETDVHATADGVAVLAHDPDLQRTAGVAGQICDWQWEQLSQIELKDGRTLPRLDEALAAFPQMHFNVDLKADHSLYPALQAVRRGGALSRVRFASFSARRLTALRRQEPRVFTSLGVRDVVALLGVAQLGWRCPHLQNQWRGAQVDAVQVPESAHGVPVVTERFIAAAHQHNLAVHVWTVDDPAQMRRLLNLGVDGLITDRPSVALTVLQKM